MDREEEEDLEIGSLVSYYLLEPLEQLYNDAVSAVYHKHSISEVTHDRRCLTHRPSSSDVKYFNY